MWEYKDIYLNWGASGYDVNKRVIMTDSLVDQLNEFGQNRWQLVQIRLTSTGAHSGIATFKRKVIDAYGYLEVRME